MTELDFYILISAFIDSKTGRNKSKFNASKLSRICTTFNTSTDTSFRLVVSFPNIPTMPRIAILNHILKDRQRDIFCDTV